MSVTAANAQEKGDMTIGLNLINGRQSKNEYIRTNAVGK